MKKFLLSALVILLLLGMGIPTRESFAAEPAQVKTAEQKAAELLGRLTPAEKVGQVFLVSFNGVKADEQTQIYNLIQELHIGGVILQAENDNFTGPENTATSAQQLIYSLQNSNWQSVELDPNAPLTKNYIPLLVGISQEGNGFPNDQILNGLTPLPAQMAIGATWDVSKANIAGTILGKELNALGFNLVLGPSLDVLDNIQVDGGESLGVRTFGGDPFWVGEMGKAYIKGLHEGSNNQLAVIATHFPGQGSSDRQPEQEVATVRKSLEQLKQIELAPFFSVASRILENPSQSPEGFLLSNIRYQGFQGNIRATTKPISFDTAALDQILSLSQFTDWRAQGGIIISDNLSNPAVRKFFDPLNTGFDARQVAKSALIAGNDIIFLGDVISTNDGDALTTVSRTVSFFLQKYEEDNAFKLRVDEAVFRILKLKYELYPDFLVDAVLPTANSLEDLDQGQNQVSTIAQKAVTLISPELNELNLVLPEPPQLNDRIVFISDQASFQQCSTCTAQTLFPAEAIKSAVMRLYGPGAGDQIQVTRLMSYSYDSLKLLLDKAEGIESLQYDLNSADWIIFSFTGFNNATSDTELFRRLYNERTDLVRNKKVIGMAFNAPYLLDSTDISKFTAYYCLYSKIPASYNVAARVLFQELSPAGRPPVSVPGIGYDLISSVSPDPDQIIALYIESVDEEIAEFNTPPSDYSKPLLYKAGDTVPITTGVIVDKNRNPVPDGTIVKFLIDATSTTGTVDQFEVQTTQGIAKVTYVIPSIGSLKISASAEPAMMSRILRLDITDAGGVVTSYQPTAAPAETAVITPTAMPTPTEQLPTAQRHQAGALSVVDWILSAMLILGCCLLFSWFARKSLSMKWMTIVTLCMGLGGNLGYLYLASGLPGAGDLIKETGTQITLVFVFIGLITGLGFGFLMFVLRRKKPSVKQ